MLTKLNTHYRREWRALFPTRPPVRNVLEFIRAMDHEHYQCLRLQAQLLGKRNRTGTVAVRTAIAITLWMERILHMYDMLHEDFDELATYRTVVAHLRAQRQRLLLELQYWKDIACTVLLDLAHYLGDATIHLPKRWGSAKRSYILPKFFSN